MYQVYKTAYRERVQRHRELVFEFAIALGVPSLQARIHDLSKFSPSEQNAYIFKFTIPRLHGSTPTDQDEQDFQVAFAIVLDEYVAHLAPPIAKRVDGLAGGAVQDGVFFLLSQKGRSGLAPSHHALELTVWSCKMLTIETSVKHFLIAKYIYIIAT